VDFLYISILVYNKDSINSFSQRLLVTIGSACVVLGLSGLLIFGGSSLTFLWIIILGIGGGFTFSLSMMFLSLRTKNADKSARLSGMAQGKLHYLILIAHFQIIV